MAAQRYDGVGHQFPTVREFVANQVNPRREITIQPITDNTLQPSRPIGFLNLRERIVKIFQEESNKACQDDPKYKTFSLKGRLNILINDTERVFIEINDCYPHGTGPQATTNQNVPAKATTNPIVAPQATSNQNVPGHAKSNQNEAPSNQSVPAKTASHQNVLTQATSNQNESESQHRRPDLVKPSARNEELIEDTSSHLDQSMLDTVTSLGQLELLRRYNASHEDSQDGENNKSSPSSGEFNKSVPKQSSLNIIDPDESIPNHDKDNNKIQTQVETPKSTVIGSLAETEHQDGEKSLQEENKQDETLNSLKCYLCEEYLADRMSLLLHVEKHCQTLAEKVLDGKSANTYIHLKEFGISIGETTFELQTETTKIKKEPSAKSTPKVKSRGRPKGKTTKIKKKVPKIEYDSDIEIDYDDGEDFSDNEDKDPTFTDEMLESFTKPKRQGRPRTRSKTTTPNKLKSKDQIFEGQKIGFLDDPEQFADLEVLPPEELPIIPGTGPKTIHTPSVTAPFKARPIKTKTTLKRGTATTPKMTLKIRMKEKAKALAIKTANQALINPNLECNDCPKKFSNKRAYLRHVRRHNVKKCQCDICGKEFSTLDSLCHHQRGLHSDVKPYSCEECGQNFNFHHSYKLHRQKHLGLRPYKCDHCHKSYLTSSHLKAHRVAVHSQARKDKFICSTCGKSFNYQNSLRTHQMIHSGERPYSCSQCQKGFISRQALRTHELSYHVTSKNFKCDVCQKFYKSAMLLSVHKRRHTADVSRFMCDICGRQFMFKSNLESHKFVHQEGRPFTCDTCGKAFKCMSSLYTHQYTHKQDTPFLCKICGKAFKTKNCCKAHERRHTAEKSFICPTCGSCFPDKGGLSKHIKTIHNPSKHFVCKLCNKVGTRADNMRTHVKSHGKDIGQENVENFIVEVLNSEGAGISEQVGKTRLERYPQNSTTTSSEVPNPTSPVGQQTTSASTINYSQMDMYQTSAPSNMPNHPSSSHHEELMSQQQHYASHSMTNIIPHPSLNSPVTQSQNHAHSMTPPVNHSNSMTPPLNHSTTTMTPPITQAIMQMNPESTYATLHPLATEALVMGGLPYPSIYAPYKQN